MARRLLITTVALTLAVFGLAGCPAPYEFRYETDPEVIALLAGEAPGYPDTHFTVAADPHLYSARLGTDGAAFEEYLAWDRKLLVESEEILGVMSQRIQATGAEFLIVCGDLTKDGERLNHELMAAYLAEVRASGMGVYVVPGNHDLNNPHAYRYEGAARIRVPTVTAREFRQIYWDFGYGEAIAEDPASLSYIAEPVEGLWLLCLDATVHARNLSTGYPETGARLKDRTLGWMEDNLIAAAKEGKAVLAVLHHGVVPHWSGQEEFHPEYLVARHREISRMLAAYHVRIAFTGHYHSQDVALSRVPEGFIFDIATGSFVTYPCPFREVRVEGNLMRVESHFLDAIPSRPDGFPAYAYNYAWEGIYGMALNTLMDEHFVPRRDATYIAARVADAVMAHYAGDEDLGGRDPICADGLGFVGRAVVLFHGYMLEGLWINTEGSDNFITIDLANGAWTE